MISDAAIDALHFIFNNVDLSLDTAVQIFTTYISPQEQYELCSYLIFVLQDLEQEQRLIALFILNSLQSGMPSNNLILPYLRLVASDREIERSFATYLLDSSMNEEVKKIGERTAAEFIAKTQEPPLSKEQDDDVAPSFPRGIFHQLYSSQDNWSTVMNKAIREKLTLSEEQQLLNQLQQQHLLPCDVPGLVKNNPNVAVEFFLRLINNNEFSTYFQALHMSLLSMEVVSRLTTAVDLPKECIHAYVNHCMNCCRKNDKSKQHLMVSVLCVFVMSLIRNRAINVNEMFVEIQDFCIEFREIRECAILFRLIKALE